MRWEDYFIFTGCQTTGSLTVINAPSFLIDDGTESQEIVDRRFENIERAASLSLIVQDGDNPPSSLEAPVVLVDLTHWKIVVKIDGIEYTLFYDLKLVRTKETPMEGTT